jgi:hypothetical protein
MQLITAADDASIDMQAEHLFVTFKRMFELRAVGKKNYALSDHFHR